MDDKFKALVACFGIGSVTAIEVAMITQGINGVVATTIVGAITAIVGATIGAKLGSKTEGSN